MFFFCAEMEAMKFVTQRKHKEDDSLGADIMAHIPFGGRGKISKKQNYQSFLQSSRQSSIGYLLPSDSHQNPYPLTNEFATQLCRISHPDDAQE